MSLYSRTTHRTAIPCVSDKNEVSFCALQIMLVKKKREARNVLKHAIHRPLPLARCSQNGQLPHTKLCAEAVQENVNGLQGIPQACYLKGCRLQNTSPHSHLYNTQQKKSIKKKMNAHLLQHITILFSQTAKYRLEIQI